MHDLKTLIKYKDIYSKELVIRGYLNASSQLKKLISLKKKNYNYNLELEQLVALINKENQLNNNQNIVEKITFELQKKKLIKQIKLNKQSIDKIIVTLPNVSHQADYCYQLKNDKVSRVNGSFSTNDHGLSFDKLIKKFNLINFKQSTAMYGSKNVTYVGKGAELIRALANYCLDFNKKRKYIEINSPSIVSKDIGIKTGKLPKFREDLYFLQQKPKQTEEYFLSPTGELQLTAYYANTILDVTSQQTYKLTTYSNCFRKEAGTNREKTKANLRIHEFHKVEIVDITTKSLKKSIFKQINDHISELITSLGLNYRVINLGKKNLSFSAQFTNDYEIYFCSSKKYIEVSSASDCGDFQTRRLKTRYVNPTTKRKEFFNSFNASALAIDRLFSAIIESYYHNGVITIPPKLQKYLSFSKII